MATPLPSELAREFAAVAPARTQLWAIGATAPATSAYLEALDWMLAIIWPFAYDEPFRLGALEAPSEVSRVAATLRDLSRTYPSVDVVPVAEPPGGRVAAAADELEANCGRWLAFEALAIDLARRNDAETTRPPSRAEQLRAFWSSTTRADLAATEVDAAARMLRVTLDRVRADLWRAVRVEVPTTPEDWARYVSQ